MPDIKSSNKGKERSEEDRQKMKEGWVRRKLLKEQNGR